MWLYYVLLAVALWGGADVTAKVLIGNYVKKPLNIIMAVGMATLPFSLAVGLASGGFFSPWPAPLAVLGGLLWVLGVVAFYRALEVEEPSRVTPLIFLKPVLVLLLATAFLGEVFMPLKYLGIALVVAGALLISFRLENGFLRRSAAVKYVIGFVLCWGLLDVFAKFLLGFIHYWAWITYFMVGVFLSTPVLWFRTELRKSFLESFRNQRVLVTALFMTFVVMVGVISFAIALSIGPVSLISAVNSVQALMVLLYAALLSLIAPKLLKEDIRGSILAVKLAAILCIISGVYFIS